MEKENNTTEKSDVTDKKIIKKVFSGTVMSNKMKDTIVVAVTRYVKHTKYKKFVKMVKRYKVHDAGNTKEVGDNVTIVETRPISKDKAYKVV